MAEGQDFAPLEALTERELEVLGLVAEGMTNREVGQELFISPETVKWYTKQIYGKLGVGNRTEAVTRARDLHLFGETPGQPEMAPPRPAPRHNLPHQLTSFVGRKAEIAEVQALMADAHLLTINGPGGTGKTRLALRVAEESAEDYADGVTFVGLASLDDPALVGQAIAGTLGLTEGAGGDVTASLGHYLSNRHTLLVLDNFEHVLDAAPLVSELLAEAPQLTVLATSRESLRLYGEHEYALSPLQLPEARRPQSLDSLEQSEAVALFLQRARAVAPDFTLTEENAEAVAEICVKLDGLPLALELAAARVKLLGLEALRGRLEDRLGTLTGGARDAPARQRTLRGTIDWSYDLLDEAEKTLFARLSIFSGGGTLEAIEAICAEGLAEDPVEALASLVDKSLALKREGTDGELRFWMLETVREYARERLVESGEAEAMQARRAEYYAALVERVAPDVRAGKDQLRWLTRLEAEYGNIRGALEWALDGGDIEAGLEIIWALAHFWYRQSRYAEGEHWMERGLELADDAPAAVRAKVMYAAGIAEFYLHDRQAAKAYLRQAQNYFGELGDKRELGWIHIMQGTHSFGVAEEYEEAIAVTEEGLVLLREAGDRAGEAQGLNVIGELARMHGDYQLALTKYNESLTLAREIGDKLREAIMLGNYGLVAMHEGDPRKARAAYVECLRVASETNNLPIVVFGIHALAGALAELGLPERAARLIGAAHAFYDDTGSGPQPNDVAQLDHDEMAVRAKLGDEAFVAGLAEGRAMSLEEAAVYALESEV